MIRCQVVHACEDDPKRCDGCNGKDISYWDLEFSAGTEIYAESTARKSMEGMAKND